MFKAALRAFGVPLVTLIILLLIAAAQAQPTREHPAKDVPIHEQYYSKWDRPNMPNHASCCNTSDCFSTKFKEVSGTWFALKREWKDGDYVLADEDVADNWVLVPDEVLENRLRPGAPILDFHGKLTGTVTRQPLDSPDGRNHVCMRDVNEASGDMGGLPTGAVPQWTVFCAVLGNNG